MVNGLDIGIEEFQRMKSMDRDLLMYKNLKYIRGRQSEYKLNKKIQYFWLVGLTLFVGLKKFIGF